MRIPEEIPILWYGNDQGEVWIPDLSLKDGPPEPPEGFIYQHSEFPNHLIEVILLCEANRSTELMRGGASFSCELVTAMVRSGDYDVCRAIQIAGKACGRCSNVLHHKHEVKGKDGNQLGYEEYSVPWHQSNTTCLFCEHEPESSVEDTVRLTTNSDTKNMVKGGD